MTILNTCETYLTIEGMLEEGDLEGAIAMGHSLAILCMTPRDFEGYVTRMLDCFDEQYCYSAADRRRLEYGFSQMRKTRLEVCRFSDKKHQDTVRQALRVA